MASFNRIFLMGNLTKDPELRYIPSGQAVCTIRLAVSEGFKSKSGEGKQETTFVDVVVWARQAETVAQYLKKGSQCLVEGRLRIREFEGRDGQRRSRTEIIANRVQFLGRPARGDSVPRDEAPPVAEPEVGESQGPVDEPLPDYNDNSGM